MHTNWNHIRKIESTDSNIFKYIFDKKIAEYICGLGQSTGSGFGTLYKTENKHLYQINV